MNKLEVFFDYICPFCLRGNDYLRELHASYPNIEIVWRPCEIHPRPEERSRYTDLVIQGLYFAVDMHADIWEYNERMFNAAVKERLDINDVDVLAECVEGLLDTDAFRKALTDGDYAKVLQDGNRYAFEQNGIWAVPFLPDERQQARFGGGHRRNKGAAEGFYGYGGIVQAGACRSVLPIQACGVDGRTGECPAE